MSFLSSEVRCQCCRRRSDVSVVVGGPVSLVYMHESNNASRCPVYVNYDCVIGYTEYIGQNMAVSGHYLHNAQHCVMVL